MFRRTSPALFALFLAAAGSTAACDSVSVDAAPLVRIDVEPPGASCPSGGHAVKSGADSDGDGVLDDAEVTTTKYLCDGGSDLVTQAVEPPGAHCAHGGTAVHAGHDADGDGALAGAEISATAYVCKDLTSLPMTRFDFEPAGSHCPAGGTAVRTGIDGDGDGALGPAEVTTTQYVCNDSELTRVDVIAAGAVCPGGGVLVQAGADRDADGTLDDDEIAHGETVCGDVIEGNVDLYTQADLDRLRDVKAITGSLHVRTGGLVSALELPSLRAIGGDLDISYASGVAAIAAPQLATVAGMVEIASLPALHALSLPTLGSAGSLTIRDDASLTTLSLPALTQVHDDVSLANLPLDSLDLSALRYIGDLELRGLSPPELSLPQLAIADNVYVFENTSASFSAPALSYVNGNLGIGLQAQMARLELPSLTMVKGGLTLRDMPLLVSFDLPRLEELGDQLAIWNNATLERFTMPRLQRVQGGLGLAIDSNPALASLSGLSNVYSIEGDFYFVNNEALRDLSELTSLRVVSRELLVGGTHLTHLGLPALTTVGSDLSVGRVDRNLPNPFLETVDLPRLRDVGSLVVSSDAVLTRFELPRLRAVWDLLELWDVPLVRKCQVDAFVSGLAVAPTEVHLVQIDTTSTCD